MSTTLKVLIAAAGLLALAVPALADGPAHSKLGSLKDSPPVAGHCSSGPFAGSYIGGAVGYAWTRSEADVYQGGNHSDSDDNKVVGSLISGYNWQCDRFVFGVESDSNFTNIESRSVYSDGSIKSEMNYFGTLRGRVGVVHENMLFYFTGGLAYAKVEHSISAPIYSFSESDSDWKFGYVLGGGVELNRGHWSLRAEGLYVDLHDTDHRYTIGTACGGSCYSNTKWDDSFFVARVGVTFKFGFDEPLHHEPLK